MHVKASVVSWCRQNSMISSSVFESKVVLERVLEQEIRVLSTCPAELVDGLGLVQAPLYFWGHHTREDLEMACGAACVIRTINEDRFIVANKSPLPRSYL